MSNAAARQRPADIRLALKAAGFSPVACIGKDAVLAEWREPRRRHTGRNRQVAGRQFRH